MQDNIKKAIIEENQKEGISLNEFKETIKETSQDAEVQMQKGALEQADEDGGNTRNFKNKHMKMFITIIAIAMSLFHIYVLGFKLIDPLILFSTHWGFGMVLIFLIYPATKKSRKDIVPFYDMIFAALSFLVTLYVIINFNTIMIRSVSGTSNIYDLIFGGIAILLTLEAARRTIGLGLPVVSIVLILYTLYGNVLPQFIACKGYRLPRFIGYIFGTEGLFSTPLKMSAQYVFLLVLFGAFLNVSGAGDFFMRYAMALAGASRGGPAKVAVLSSALFGSISGSAVANVVGTGTFTIPLMKKIGYSPAFAGAVEAVASTGGQIMPPIMGAGAFIMAELIGAPYSTIAWAALIPALMYYYSIFISIDLEAAKNNLVGVKKEEMERPSKVFLSGWHLVLPIGVLIYSLGIRQDSVSRAALFAVLACYVASLFKKETRMNLKKVLFSLELGGLRSLTIISAVACAGIAIGCIMLTGLGLKFTYIISQIAGSSVFLSLLFSALAAAILGMGLPTVAAYIISASVLAAGLISLGISPLATHMFLFYYSILSMITPPVALAAYAGANLAGASFNKVGFLSMRLGLIAFILPFFFVYGPALLLMGTVPEIIIAVITSLIGTTCFAIAQYGWIEGKTLNVVQRIVMVLGALLMIIPGGITDVIGIFIVSFVVFIDKDLRGNVAKRFTSNKQAKSV